MSTALRRVAAAAIASLSLTLSPAAALPARAEILSGCVAPEDAGVSNLVGWVDGGVMLGMADPEPPASLQVTAPDGSVANYRDGVGLLVPTDVLPIWFAPAPLVGDYELVIDGGERCTISVGDATDRSVPATYEIELDWVPQSAPVHQP
ncbi:MAG: hypothetical protein NTX57_23365 [Armatimonadetes bacterium]|nr:hypothetical protein [Armatimonadota bacterium]